MSEFDAGGPRSAGPALVWQGPRDAPVLLVLDAAGEPGRDRLPATWRPLAEHLRMRVNFTDLLTGNFRDQVIFDFEQDLRANFQL